MASACGETGDADLRLGMDERPRAPSRRLLGSSLRAKLLLLSLGLVVVPGAVFATIAIGGARRALQHAVGRQLAEVAQDAAERVQLDVERITADVVQWGNGEAMRAVGDGDASGELSRLLTSLASGSAVPLAVAAANAGGTIVAASDPALVGRRFPDTGRWSAVMRGHIVTARASAIRPEPPALEVISPIFDSERPDAIVGGLVVADPWESMNGSLQHLQHDLAAMGLDVTIAVVGNGGRVVAGGWWAEPWELSGRDLGALGWTSPAFARSAGRPGYREEEAASALVGYAPIDDPDLAMTALAVQPVAAAVAPVSRVSRTLGIALASVLVAGLAVAVALAQRLSGPIRELTEATRELAQTGEPRPVAVRTRDEIGELAVAFNAMSADLTRARDDLLGAAKFAFVGELAAGMAHEIRTPLGIVRSSAQILGRSLPAGDARSAELVEMIVSEVDRLERVVAGLLELARPHQPELAPVFLAPLLSRALDFVTTQASERGIAVRRDFSRQDRPAVCDPEQIYQVALNLVVNALQNVPRGGSVTVRTISAGDRVGFEVSDDGPGIPRELHDRIFAPFFTRRPGGTGLGLALVQRIVQNHRGSVVVDSDVGRGATFRVELPAAGEDR